MAFTGSACRWDRLGQFPDALLPFDKRSFGFSFSNWRENLEPRRFETTKIKNLATPAVHDRVSISETQEERRRVHCDQRVRRSAGEQTVPQIPLFPISKGEVRKENPVQKTLQQCRFGPPPHWKCENDMIAIIDQPGDALKVRLPWLLDCISLVEDWVEGEIANGNPVYFGTSKAGCLIMIEQMR